MYNDQLWGLKYVILPPKCIEFPHHSKAKIFYKMILVKPLHCETQANWENLFFTVPLIKLRMFGGYISVEASTEAKTQVISICTLFPDFLN